MQTKQAFMLLVFSEWVDISYLQQDSPLGLGPFEGRGERRGKRKESVWDSVIVRVEVVKPH